MKTQKSFKLIILASLFFTLLNGCGKMYQDTKQQNITDLTMPPPEGESTKDKIRDSEGSLVNKNISVSNDFKFSEVTNRMIVRTGNINLEVDKFDEAEKKVSDAAKRFSGYITNSTSNVNAGGKEQGTISVRIPSEKFDEFISEVSEYGKVVSQNISGRDVTEEYIDLDARQKTQKELENRLLELLSEKTAKLTDVVEVEEKLSSVRENIERTEGRMRYLKDQSAFSTLTVSIFEPTLLQTSSGGGFFYEIGEGFKRGIEGFTEILSWLITFIISFSPILALLTVLYFALKKYLRNRKLRREDIQTN